MTPLRVAFEQTVLELDAAGTARAVRGLAVALRAREDVDVVALAHPAWRAARGGVRRHPAARIARGIDRESRWFWLGLPRAIRRAGVGVLHLPVALGPWRAPVPLVVTVHDVLALEHPEWFARANVAQQRLALRRLVRAARVVVAPSGHTRDRLAELTGVRARVVPWGVDARFTPGAGAGGAAGERPFVLAVGTLQPRKGLEAIAAAIPPTHDLVVAGARGWSDADVVRRLRGRVTFAGRVPDDELVRLLRGADALVHASRGEGFGFPPLEAMACGTPVVAVAAGSVPEIVGDGGVVVGADELGDAVRAVLADPGERAALAARGRARAARFTWAACADGYAAAYRDAAA